MRDFTVFRVSFTAVSISWELLYYHQYKSCQLVCMVLDYCLVLTLFIYVYELSYRRHQYTVEESGGGNQWKSAGIQEGTRSKILHDSSLRDCSEEHNKDAGTRSHTGVSYRTINCHHDRAYVLDLLLLEYKKVRDNHHSCAKKNSQSEGNIGNVRLSGQFYREASH